MIIRVEPNQGKFRLVIYEDEQKVFVGRTHYTLKGNAKRGAFRFAKRLCYGVYHKTIVVDDERQRKLKQT